MNQHPHTLPDGRVPLRYGKGRTAIYMKARGEGLVEYPFSMIKYLQKNRPRKPREAVRQVHRELAEKYKQDDPDYFRKLGSKGGKVTKDDRKHSSNTKGQRLKG